VCDGVCLNGAGQKRGQIVMVFVNRVMEGGAGNVDCVLEQAGREWR